MSTFIQIFVVMFAMTKDDILVCVSDGWEEYLDEDGDVFYYECNGGKSTYEHPCDAYFKWLYTALRQQSMVRSRT